MLKVAKFGGSSLSSSAQFEKVKNIIDSDPSRRVVVVSAPGKRSSDDNKVTDLLYLCNAHLKYDVSYDSIFEMIEERYMDIRKGCGLNADLDSEFETIRSHLKKGMSVEYLVSRGEYLNARLMAEYLGFTFVDAADVICFRYDGHIDYNRTNSGLVQALEANGSIVIPGFYGSLPNGEIRTFSRGGSDVTGAIVSAALGADVYENWTDVSGILMVDPRIVSNPKSISRVTYDELREMSYMGAAVLHEDTVFPVRRKNIPVNIRNTNKPEDPGTIIMESFEEDCEGDISRFITGITGKKNFTTVEVYCNHNESVSKLLQSTLGLCDRYGIEPEMLSSGIDSFSLLFPTEKLEHSKYEFAGELKGTDGVDNMKVQDNISIIAIVGRQMAYKSGISGQIFQALGEENISVRMIKQSADEINIMVGVSNDDFARAIKTLYNSFA
ncbi:MAG: aspartate kinase [Baileyella intestinalis]|uniref:aspartate kinase n=1 Tax=Baileyella intestinalis TaxID=2606709 RepID=UPI002A764471|nr:aspartate kinase [Baileyella intestinalis]MCI7685447.1 aspartate kinase [Clostridiales bacterium]MDY2994831.1 aspartate kinase [Baileyella intestinalis]